MNIFADFNGRINKAVESLDLKGQDGARLDLSRISRRAAARRLAMAISRPTRRWSWPSRPARTRGRWPRRSPKRCGPTPDVAEAEVAGPGFVNLRIGDRYWHAELAAILDAGPDYGRSAIGGGRKVNVEYVSANPTGPMHVGHCRGAVVGDALANLLAFAGYDVTKEYYINDAGAQIDVLARSVMLRYREALGDKIGEIPAGLYPGDYLVPVGQALAQEFGWSLLQQARGRGARHHQGSHYRGNDGDDPRGSGPAQRSSRGVLLGARAARA